MSTDKQPATNMMKGIWRKAVNSLAMSVRAGAPGACQGGVAAPVCLCGLSRRERLLSDTSSFKTPRSRQSRARAPLRLHSERPLAYYRRALHRGSNNGVYTLASALNVIWERFGIQSTFEVKSRRGWTFSFIVTGVFKNTFCGKTNKQTIHCLFNN